LRGAAGRGEPNVSRADAGIEALLHGPGKSGDMDIERETVVEAGVSIGAAIVFIIAVLLVGSQFRTNGDITGTGGLAVVGTIGFFVFLMAGVGVYFAYR
jgi:hypothetical protein